MPGLDRIHTDLSVSATGPRDAQVSLTGSHSSHAPQTVLQHHLCKRACLCQSHHTGLALAARCPPLANSCFH